ncbi:2-dehydropantoate 2-reductase [Endozoicomonas sp. G2_1]|uniref:2-dehydropantoate 2-reductase n=1 Tax=Endozoicomonas sp. G2_1 TaxID=2821091 RepID=UPI001AD9759D|nr:2-dehydropantoate 2-reductase [Endozoicomonas sp. G2_1]MBO9491562.1 2-dehydropantoate 2-reductase [Endozoicomonas sp. G2_1]
MKIAIFGAGSIGCYLGGRLLASGQDVVFIGRDSIKKTLADHGLVSANLDGSEKFCVANAIKFIEPSDLANVDVVLLTVKSKDTESAARDIKPYLAKHSALVSLQNGIGNGELLTKLMPEHKIITGMVPFNVVNQGQGRFFCGTEGALAFESIEPAKMLSQYFVSAGIDAMVSDDIASIQWGKLLLNLNNAINVIADLPLKQQLENRDYRRVLALSMIEALGVLAKAGIAPAKVAKVGPSLLPHLLKLPNWLFTRIAASMLKIDAQARSSMWEDLQLGRPTEIAYLNGEIVKLAHQIGSSAPVNEAIIKLIEQIFTEGKDNRMQITGSQLYQQLR